MRQVVQGYIAQIAIERDGDGYHAFCKALPGLHVAGSTRLEAAQNATNAAELYLDSMAKHGELVPLHRVGCRVWQTVLGTVPPGHWRCDCGLNKPEMRTVTLNMAAVRKALTALKALGPGDYGSAAEAIGCAEGVLEALLALGRSSAKGRSQK